MHDTPARLARHPGLVRFQSLFSSLTAASVAEQARALYADDAHFSDTLVELRGADAIAAYLGETARKVQSCTIEIEDVSEGATGHYLRWTMTMRAPRLGGGKPLRSRGITHLQFDAGGKVTLHQDYWDAAGNFFEHLPVVGVGLRWIKRRL